MPSLQVSGTLRSKVTQRVARAVGIALAHSEGQIVAEILRQHQSTSSDSTAGDKLLLARGFGFGLVHTNHRDVFKVATDTATSSLVVHPAFWQVVSRAGLGPEDFCLNWSKLWVYVVPGSVCEEHVDDLSQFVTNTSRTQLFHDAAPDGKAVEEGTAKLGPTLSCKSTLLANDKSLGKLSVGHFGDEGVPICSGTPVTDLGGRNRSGEREMCSKPMETHMERQTMDQKSSPSMQKMNSEAQELTMTSIHPVQVCGHTAQGTSTAQVNAMCKNLKKGTVMGKTQACAMSTVAWFFGEKRVPQTPTRVEQVSEWITMWRGFNVDTRRRIRKVRRKKAPILGRDPRRMNQATGPISATICSVLEAGWKPSTPGFWQTPDASATLDGALFNKAQIIDCFSKDMDMQTWKRAAGQSLSSGMEKGINTDFAKKARSQLIKEGNFMAARALDFLVCGAINEPRLLADGPVSNHFFCVRCDQRALATRKHELWDCPGNRLINHTHERIKPPCDTGTGIFGHTTSFVWPWSFAV